MKKITKIISVALVLLMTLSIMLLPASAVNVPTATAEVKATYQGKTTAGYDYYKFSVYLDSTLSLNAYQLNITWQDSVWQPLRATNKRDATSIGAAVMDKNDTENIMFQTCDAYLQYGANGENGFWPYAPADNGEAYMPGDSASPSLNPIGNDNIGTTLQAEGYTGLYSSWAGDFGGYNLCISGGTINGANSPTSGKVMVLSWYMRLKDGVAPGNYEVGFNAKQIYRLTAQYCFEDAVTTKECSDQLADIPADKISYSNAVVTIGSAGPVVRKSAGQVKMTVIDKEAQTVEDEFQLRIISLITAQDWDKFFKNTPATKGGERITHVGMVVYVGENYDENVAKEIAKTGNTEGYEGYHYAETDYIRQNADTYTFGAVLKCKHSTLAANPMCLGFVSYKDASEAEQTIVYEGGAYEAPLKTKYDAIKTAYLGV